MVRLMLTLTPVVCVLASIAFSVTLDNYIHIDAVPIDEGEEEEEENEEEHKEITHEKKKVGFGISR
jgi:dolichyl-diphosphooligosaccharide--protein glycosyltransferase